LPPGPGFSSLPFRFELLDDGLYVVGPSHSNADLLSARVTGFGDVPAEAVVARVMELLPRMKEDQLDQARIQDHPIRDIYSGTYRVAADALYDALSAGCYARAAAARRPENPVSPRPYAYGLDPE